MAVAKSSFNPIIAKDDSSINEDPDEIFSQYQRINELGAKSEDKKISLNGSLFFPR